MKRRICMVAVGKLPVPAVQGGASEALAQTLLDENEKNPQIEFTVLTVDHPKARELAAAYRHAKFVWFKPQVLWNKFWWRIRAACKAVGNTVLPFPYQRVQAAAWLEEHQDEFDLILTECDLDIVQRAKVPPEKVLYHIHWVGEPTPKNDASFGHLLPVSRYVGENWVKATGRSMDTVHVLPNCVADYCFKPPLPQVRQQMCQGFDIASDAFVILFAGRLVAYKGVKELLEAVNALPGKDVALMVVGSTNFGLSTCDAYEKEVRELAEKSSKNVQFAGFVPNDQLEHFYAMADVVVVPSLCQEAASMVTVEAMAAGCPVVATVSGGLPEYLNPQCGILIPQGENLVQNLTQALQQLQKDPQRRQAMGQAGRAWAGQFKPAAYYQRFLEILQEL